MLFLIFVLLGLGCQARHLDKCEIARELTLHGFPEDKLRDWVCLVENASGGMTDGVSQPLADGSRNHGLFRVNDHYWCSNSDKPGQGCNVTCAEICTDDITKAAECAMTVYKAHQGFTGWKPWNDHCQSISKLPNLNDCPIAYQLGSGIHITLNIGNVQALYIHPHSNELPSYSRQMDARK